MSRFNRRRQISFSVSKTIESLETRTLFSVLTVNTIADNTTSDNVLSLREAIAIIENAGDANAAVGHALTPAELAQIDTTTAYGTNDTIQFDASIAGQTITVGSEFSMVGTMKITGGATGMTLSGGSSQAAWRAFNVAGNANATLDHLTLTNFSDRGANTLTTGGNAQGGAILVNMAGVVTISNSTISNSSAIGGIGQTASGSGLGGAISIDAGTLTITNTTIMGNAATGGIGQTGNAGDGIGGAIYSANGSNITVTNSTISSNIASGGASGSALAGAARGGALYMLTGTLGTNGSTFNSNTATGGAGNGSSAGSAFGGVLFTDSTTNTLADTKFQNSTTTGGSGGIQAAGSGWGGAIYSQNSANTLNNVNISHNSVAGGDSTATNAGDAIGAGLFSSGGTNSLNQVVISNNTGTGGTAGGVGRAGIARGGALATDVTANTIDSSEFDFNSITTGNSDSNGNSNEVTGGALFANGSTLNMTGSEISNNIIASGSDATASGSAMGGGIFMTQVTSSFTNCTIVQNSAVADSSVTNTGPSVGGGIFVTGNNTGIDFCTISNNVAISGGRGVYIEEDFATSANVTNSIIGQTDNSVEDFTTSGVVSLSGSNNLVRNTASGLSNISNADPMLSTLGSYGGPTQTMGLVAGSPAIDAAGATSLTHDQRGGHRINGGTADIGAFETLNSPFLVSANHTTFVVGTAGSYQYVTQDYPIPTVSATGTLPSGVTFTDNGDGSGTFAGTPAAGTQGVYIVTITSVSTGAPVASPSFTLTVNSSPIITSANHATFIAGTTGTFTMTSVGLPVATLSETGTLPSGITFVDNGDGTATLSGNAPATAAGIHNLTLKASNGVGTAASQAFTLEIDASPAFTSAAGATFTNGQAGTFSITTTGYPVPTVTETGTLPTGLSFTDNGNGTATLAGTPTSGIGTFPIQLGASNGIGSAAAQSFTITVNNAPAITSANHVAFAAGVARTFTVTTTALPVASLSKTGSLPTGITLVDNGDGTATLAGSALASAAGLHNFTINASNGVGSTSSQAFTLEIDAAPAFFSGANTAFTTGHAKSFTITTAGYPTAAVNETGALPAGLTFIDNGNGTATLSGTATDSGGIYSLQLGAINGIGAASQSFSLEVDTAPAITSTASANYFAGSPVSFTFTTTGYPIASLAEAGSLPTGLAFTANHDGTATLTGTPGVSTTGTYTLAISAGNAVSPDASQTFSLVISDTPTAPVFTSGDQAQFTFGTFGSFTITTAGLPTASIAEAGPLPEGLTFVDNGDGSATLSGTPTARLVSDYSVNLSAANGNSPDALQAFKISVASPYTIKLPVALKNGSLAILDGSGATQVSLAAPKAKSNSTSRVAIADLNGDGTPDYIFAAAAGLSKVVAYDGATGAKLFGFLAFDPSFHNGVFVSAGDVNGDGVPDVVVGQGGGQSKIRVFNGVNQKKIADFSAFENTRVGARVSVGDINGDGYADVFAAEGGGKGPKGTVRIFDGKKLAGDKVSVLSKVKPFGNNFGGGMFVSAGDVNGDGVADVIVSAGTGKKAKVSIFNGVDNTLLSTITPPVGTKTHVASHDLNQDGIDDILIVTRHAGISSISAYDGTDGSLLETYNAPKGATYLI